MDAHDPLTTQRDVAPDIAGELRASGFDEPIVVGRGGFGVVYRCEQPALDRTVAVKVLTDHFDPASVERFMREQRAMGRLSGHPNIVNILEVGATPGAFPFIVMPFHAHGSLDARIRAHGPLEWRDVLHLGVKMCGALETAHRSGTLHRDMKPGNILLTEYGEPQLTDFGIARISGGFETETDMVTGSPAFTAPELLAGGEPTVASDIYGLGATLFCALTGHAAFERRSGEQVVAQFLRIASQPVPDLRKAGVPDEVCRTVEHAMSREPEDRARSAVDYGNELRDIQQRLGVAVDDMAIPVEAASSPLLTVPSRSTPEHTTAPPTPATKFRPPLRPRAQVPRKHLMDILRAGEQRRLILIHAPVGYGKTTVAVQWGEELTRDGVTVAWLTVDDDDNTSTWFLTHLLEAIRRVDPDIVGDLAEMIEEHGDKAQQYVLTTLIDAIHDRGQRVALIVDDWHQVTDPAALGAMEFLLDHGSHHLQLIITSRTRSGLPLSRMRVSDELVEIDVAGLCFDADEARSFLVDVAGLELECSDITQLWNSTDGWAAALQLACLSLRGADKPAELIGHISGRHHAIGDFLAENVLGALEPEMLSFLLTISIPDRVCASLATALSGEARGQALLEDVETRDLFLRRNDDDGDWFSFHPLFGEFLRRRLERDHPERVTPLHRTASQWFADHNLLAESVHHALDADDAPRAVELVEQHGRDLIEHSHVATLLGLIDKLPPLAVASSPWLQLWLGWSNMLMHRTDTAHAALERVDAALVAQRDADLDVAVIKAEVDVAEACARAISDRFDGVDDLINESLEHPDTVPPFVVSAAANAATASATGRFDFAAAHRWQAWAAPYHHQNTGPYGGMYGYALDGIAWFEQLDLDRAEHCFRTAVQVSGRTHSGQTQIARLASVLLAELLYERGRIDESAKLLDEAFRLGVAEGLTDMIKARFLVGARLAVFHGDRKAAADILDDGADTAEQLGSRRLRAHIEAEQAALGLPARRGLRSRVPYDNRAIEPKANAIRIAQLTEEVAIRLLIEDGSTDLACRWAREWVDRLADSGRPRALLRSQRLLATCLSAAGREFEAKRCAAVVLARCATTGMARHPMDGGDIFRHLVEDIRVDLGDGHITADFDAVPVEFVERLLRSSSAG
ncbi:protein kinase [Gordonia sp. CPCC 205515]|uniref:protein kinase domain-containing protein n=1 Tax=Gordonia sp. CPCC 205515 TaxID=3140791 RepID=UPI003AF3B86C